MFFQQVTLAYMVHYILQKEDFKEIKNFYNWIDNNKYGKMEYIEFNEGFKQFIDINEKEVTKIFKYIAHIGCIEFEEFIKHVLIKINYYQLKIYKNVFAYL